jgi:hypothetical protein
VVGAHDDRIALEEAFEAARGLHEAPERPVGALERAERGVRPGDVGGVVVVREVEDEEVEAVARHEPGPDGGSVVVDRALEPRADGERRSRDVRLEEVEEEEASGAVGRLVPAVPPGQSG